MKKLKKPIRRLNLPAAIKRAAKAYFSANTYDDDAPYGCYTDVVKLYFAELKAGKAERYFTYDELVEYLDSFPSIFIEGAIWRLGGSAPLRSVANEFHRYTSQLMGL